MNNFEFENQLGAVHLVYRIQPHEEVDTFLLGMLCNNEIQGVAKTTFTQIDSEKIVKYNVSSKISASRLFDGPVNKKRLIGVFSGIIDAMLSVEEYMIDQRALLLDLDYIFTDVTTCETVMICLPLTDAQTKSIDLSAFLKNVIFQTQFDQTENCDHVAKILNFLNSGPTVALSDFKELLEKITKEEQLKKAAPTISQVSQPAVKLQSVVQQPSVQPAAQQSIQASQPVVQRGVTPPVQQNVKVEPVEKPMTMFYLLRHYSKENAAKYKAQQEAQKAQKTSDAAGVSASKSNQQASPKAIDPGFAIPGQQSSQVSSGYTASVQQVIPSAQMPAQQAKSVEYQEPISRSAAQISFGETTVLSSGQIGETTVLGAMTDSTRVDPHLIRTRNNEKIPLNKPVFRIGKERSYVDYFIGDNTAISRSHANIVNHNGEFYVVDTNSTNHTYVNGGMIQSNVETKLSHGTKIRFANEDFEFRLY